MLSSGRAVFRAGMLSPVSIDSSQPATPDLAMKYLKSFVDELPRGHPLGLCRELHKPDVWFNRLLMALKFKDASGERLDIAEIRVALEMHKFFSAVDVNDLDRQVRRNALAC